MLIRIIHIAKNKHFFLGAFFALILFLSYLISFPDGEFHVVFCDVGQGDGIYMKFPDGSDVLVDGGPNNKILNCLSDHMAFYDRKIETVVLTHPQADHMTGLEEVLQRYDVDLFVLPPVGNDTKGYSELKKIIQEKNINFTNLYKGNVVQFKSKSGKNLSLQVVWPEEQWAREKLNIATAGNNWSKNILGVRTKQDLNDFSIVTIASFGDFDVLLTGDLEAGLLEGVVKNIDRQVEVLKVSHHGGKNGLNENIVNSLKPKLAVISVGKNSYGHPNDTIITMLKNSGAEVLKTDEIGDIEVISDGKRFWVRE